MSTSASRDKYGKKGSKTRSRSLPDGFTRAEVNNTSWEVLAIYSSLNLYHVDNYGQICTAKDSSREAALVHIKKLAQPFETQVNAQRTYRELTLLKNIRHENIIHMRDCFSPFTGKDTFKDLYIVIDSPGTSLDDIIKANQLTGDHVEYLAYQMLCAVKFIHSCGLIHADLKPKSFFVDENTCLKLSDFGAAKQTEVTSAYVSIKWYRAPELVMQWSPATEAADVWSLGCIIAEMMMAKPMFKGTDEIDQLTKVLQFVGKPDESFTRKIQGGADIAAQFFASMPAYKKKSVDSISCLCALGETFVDFLDKILVLDAEKRPTVKEALTHPYLTEYHDPDDEPVADADLLKTLRPQDMEKIRIEAAADFWRLLTRDIVLDWRSGNNVDSAPQTDPS